VFSTLVLALSGAVADEQPLQFVHALQENGYGDMAVEYLKMLEQQPDQPAEVREVWDLEMAKSLKAAAAAAFDAKDYEALMAESQKHLAKFIKERSNHPEAMTAIASWADFVMKHALDSLRSAKAQGPKGKEYEKLVADARTGLNDAREKFQQSQKKFQARIEALPPPPQPPAKRADRAEAETRRRLETNLHETQFQLALIDYYLAQTFLDPKSAERTAGLKKAAQAFDDIYQQNRGSVTGLYAHMWHGKTAEELGDLSTALDIYDEVLANAPEPTDRGPATGLEPLFAQVERFRLMIVQKQKPLQFLPEASAWLKEYRKLKQTEGYQGIALDVAQAMLAAARNATGPKKSEMTGSVLQIVTDCAKIRSPYQQELVLLRREILSAAGRDTQVNNFDEAVALAKAAAANSDWQKALDAYRQAIELAQKSKLRNPAGIAEAHEAIDRLQLVLAGELFNQGKFSECLSLAGKIVRDEQGAIKTQSATAAQASALGVAAMLDQYRVAPEIAKPAALARLVKLAEFTQKNWPDRPEADEARMALGQAKLVVAQARPAAEQVREAIAVFERVNPKSNRYPVAMYLAGETYWRLYVGEKARSEPAGKDAAAADRGKAEQRIRTALELFRKQCEPGRPKPRYMLETELLLAEMCNEAGQAKEAAALYQPLIETIKAEKPKTFDTNTIRIFLGAVRTYCTLKELDKAGDASAVLVSIGPDALPVNDVLVEFAKLLNLERKKADAQVTELEIGIKAEELKAARARLASMQDLLGKILLNLAQRKELGLGHMIFVGETLNTIGMTVEASQLFQKILDRMKTDQDFAQRGEKALSLIRTELLKALRKQEKYDEALKQVDQLIHEHPRALEPLMEKGRILESWAEKDPAKFDLAVGHWAALRTRLQAIKGKKPPQYYEVMYNVAKCLAREAEKTTDKTVSLDRAKKAEQVLKAALVLSPKLDGPDTVAKYKVLLDKAITMQGRSPGPKVEKSDAKKP
jgi:hypothetical protein